MADTNAVLQAAQQRLAENKNATGDLTNIMTDVLQGLFGIADNTQATGSRVEDGRTVYTTPLQVQTEGIAALEAQTRTQEFAKQIGISSDFAADVQMQLASQIAEASRAALEQGKVVQEMKQVGLFDDPLQFMVNQVLLPDEQNKLNAHLGVVENNRMQLAAINQATQQSAVTSNAIATKITQATLDDQYDAATAALANKKAELYASAGLQTAHTIKDLYNLRGDAFNIQKDIWQVQRSDEQMQMQRESHRLAKEQANVALMKYQDEKDRLAYITDTINQAEIRQFGKPITSVNEVKFNWGSNSEVAKKQQKLFDLGSGIKAGVPVSSGDNMLERVQFLSTVPVKPGTSESGLKVAGLMQQAVAKAMEDNKGAKPEVINAEAQKIFDKQFNMWQSRVDPKDQTNPFSLPSLGALDQSAEMKSNKAYAYFRSVAKEDGPTDIDKIIHTVLPAVKNKQVSIDDLVKAVQSIDTLSRKTAEEENDIYFISGKRIKGIQVPLTWDVPLGIKPQRLVNPADPVAVKQAIISMIMPQVNWAGTHMQGDGFYPSKLYKPGVDDVAKPTGSK